ncbi:MAG TPA: hypothetical protein VFN78_11610 [Ktedonobacterales bacterium]|nr:hypothetical protein [Ktedonobacterales bacterium]
MAHGKPDGTPDDTPQPCYPPRMRVTARPLGRPIASTPLMTLLEADLEAEPQPESQPESQPRPTRSGWRGMARSVRLRGAGRTSHRASVALSEISSVIVSSRRLPGTMLHTMRRTIRRRPTLKALLVYVALLLALTQTLVGTLTPLARGERQALDGAFLALGAVVPATPTPFPLGPTPRPVSTPAAFITTMLPFAQQLHHDLGWPVSVTLAQMGVEHGWRLPDFDGWNLANSKVFPDPAGDGGVCFRQASVRDFCYAPTPQIGVAIYEHVAHLSYYAAIGQATRSGGAMAAARALGQSPWDAGHYALNGVPGGALIAAMNTYHLDQYDR